MSNRRRSKQHRRQQLAKTPDVAVGCELEPVGGLCQVMVHCPTCGDTGPYVVAEYYHCVACGDTKPVEEQKTSCPKCGSFDVTATRV